MTKQAISVQLNGMMATLSSSEPTLTLAMARQESVRLIASLNEAVPYSSHQVSAIFQAALQQLEEAGAEESEWLPLVWDVRLWFTRPRGVLTHRREGEKTPPLSERFGEWGNNAVFLPVTSLAHFETRLGQFSNPFLRARYADFLAMRSASDASAAKNAARERVLKAVPDYLASVQTLRTSGEMAHAIEAVECLDSATHLALSKAPDQLASVVQALRQHLEIAVQEVQTVEGQEVRVGRWAAESGWILLNVRQQAKIEVPNGDLQWWQEQAESLARRNGPLGESFLEQTFWSQAAEAARLRGQGTERLALLHEMARAKVREARARTQGAGASYLAGASLMEDAVENFHRLLSAAPDEATRAALLEEQRQLKLEIRRFYREGERELGVHSTPLEISRESLEAAVAPFLEPEELVDCLRRLGSSLLPNPQEAQKWADSRGDEDDISSLASASLMSEGLEIRSYSSPEEKQRWEFNRMLDWQIQSYSSVLLPLIWDRLRTEKGLNAETLLQYLDNWGFLEEARRPLLQRGIEHYFAADFASALHLLVPQLEHIIRNLFERVGLPPARPARGGNGWEFETFGTLLRRIDEHLPGLLPRELRLYVERTLSDPTGWNLCNRIAHGLITVRECSRMKTETVLHIYLSFSLFNTFAGDDHEPTTNAD